VPCQCCCCAAAPANQAASLGRLFLHPATISSLRQQQQTDADTDDAGGDGWAAHDGFSDDGDDGAGAGGWGAGGDDDAGEQGAPGGQGYNAGEPRGGGAAGHVGGRASGQASRAVLTGAVGVLGLSSVTRPASRLPCR
jgi:hypothetical protein